MLPCSEFLAPSSLSSSPDFWSPRTAPCRASLTAVTFRMRLSRLAYLNCMHLTAVACLSGCFILAARLKTLPLPLPSIHSLIAQYKFQWLWCLKHRRSLEGPVWSSQLTHENSPVGPQPRGICRACPLRPYRELTR